MMTQTILTAKDIDEGHREAYSDLYKSLHGCRPRGVPSDESLAHFYNNYDQDFEEEERREAELLRRMGKKAGREFKTWTAYYDYKEELSWAEFQADEAKRAEDAAARQQVKLESVPGIPATISAWEHGDI